MSSPPGRRPASVPAASLLNFSSRAMSSNSVSPALAGSGRRSSPGRHHSDDGRADAGGGARRTAGGIMLIAQISDLHLRASGGPLQGRIDTIAALSDCIAHVNRLSPRPDIVLATGDLTDLALPEDYALLRRMLAKLAMPLYVIAGNHDDRDGLRA